MKTRRRYGADFKESVVRKMLAGKPVGELAKEIGINRNQLYRWLRDLGNTTAPMPKQENDPKRSNRRPRLPRRSSRS